MGADIPNQNEPKCDCGNDIMQDAAAHRDLSNIDALAQNRSKEPSVAEQLVELASDFELFHNEHVAYASVMVGGHRETWRVGAQPLRSFLSRRFHSATGRVPGAQALQDALRTLEGKALFDGPEMKVHVRVAQHGDRTYLDIGDPERHVVEIDANGWRVACDAPVRFMRPRGMVALPAPVHGGSVEELRPFVNVPKLSSWRLVVAWLVAAFFPGPYPLLVLQGRQGSAKTTTSRYLRFAVDPNLSPVRAQPRGVQDLLIAAANSIFVVLDNLSFVDDWLSDALCRMSTGGGFSTRELYTDMDEVILDVQRPVILNGITDVVARGDLLDRSIIVELPSIPPDERRTEREMKAAFAAAAPRILGALLDAVSGVMRHAPHVRLNALPRMADFAVRGTALERALGWEAGAFTQAYDEAIAAAHDVALDVSVIAPLVRQLAEGGGFEGTATDLLKRLDDMYDGRWPARAWNEPARPVTKVRPQGWPKCPKSVSSHLRRLEPNLAAAGITVTFGKTDGSRSKRLVTIRKQAGGVAGVLPQPATTTPLAFEPPQQPLLVTPFTAAMPFVAPPLAPPTTAVQPLPTATVAWSPPGADSPGENDDDCEFEFELPEGNDEGFEE